MLDRFKSLALSFKKKLKRTADPARHNWLSRTRPFSREFGLDRGTAIDRKFMEVFLASHQEVIQGKVLEVGDDQYTYQFGSNLSSTVILAGSDHSARSTCFPKGDLTDDQSLINLGKYDCVIATNVLNMIFDIQSAVKGLADLVQPATGSVLATVAGLVPLSRFDYERWGDYWRFSDMSIKKLFETYFDKVDVSIYGNAPLAAAFIIGLSQEEVPSSLFDHYDADYQILIAVKASHPRAIV